MKQKQIISYAIKVIKANGHNKPLTIEEMALRINKILTKEAQSAQ